MFNSIFKVQQKIFQTKKTSVKDITSFKKPTRYTVFSETQSLI